MSTEDMANTNQGSGYRSISDKISENAAEAGDILASKAKDLAVAGAKKTAQAAKEGVSR